MTDISREEFNAVLHGLEDRYDGRFDTVNSRFDTVNSRFDAVDNRFDAVDNRFDAVDSRLDAFDTQLSSIKGTLENFAGKFATIDVQFAQVDTRFAQLDAAAQKNTADIIKWVIGTALAMGAVAITTMTFVLNNAVPKYAAPATPPAPIIIQLPPPTPAH